MESKEQRGITRRQILKGGSVVVLGAALKGCGAVISAGDADQSNGDNTSTDPSNADSGTVDSMDCVLTPELTEGPYYIDVDLLRADITEDREGVALALEATVVNAETCAPIPDVVLEIWHADALGVYSGFANEGTAGETYLRGAQTTDSDGVALINTIYPGWYSSRAVHIHAKVHLSSSSVVTTQFFFSDDLTDTVFAENAPYNTRGQRDTLNSQDNIFPNDDSVLLNIEEDGAGGYIARVTIGVQTG